MLLSHLNITAFLLRTALRLTPVSCPLHLLDPFTALCPTLHIHGAYLAQLHCRAHTGFHFELAYALAHINMTAIL
jgi:hypothetical protein